MQRHRVVDVDKRMCTHMWLVRAHNQLQSSEPTQSVALCSQIWLTELVGEEDLLFAEAVIMACSAPPPPNSPHCMPSCEKVARVDIEWKTICLPPVKV